MENEKIILNYVTKRAYCQCCKQKLPEISISKEKQFTIRKEDVLDWAEKDIWSDISTSTDDLSAMIHEFIHEIIHFNAAEISDAVVVAKGELSRVSEFILREIVE
ncbi:hypothetical protein D3C72_1780610 [compost metagenome]